MAVTWRGAPWVVTVAAAGLLAAACASEFTSEPASIVIERRDTLTATLRAGDARVVEILVRHARLGELVAPAATWRSSDESVLRVSSVPLRNTADSAAVDSLSARRTRVFLTAVSAGNATVTVSIAVAGGQVVERSFPFSVTALVMAPALKASGSTLAVSEEDELVANLDGDASLRISWQSSDDAKLRVLPLGFAGDAAHDTLAARGWRARVVAVERGTFDLTGTVRTGAGVELATRRLSVTVLPLKIARQWPSTLPVADLRTLRVQVQDIGGRPMRGLAVSWTSSDEAGLLLGGAGEPGRQAASAAIASVGRAIPPAATIGTVGAAAAASVTLPPDSAMWIAPLRRGPVTLTLRIDGVAPAEAAAVQETITINERWVDLTTGDGSTCALTFDGRPYCWGRLCNATGDATRCARTASATTPTRVTGSTLEEAIRFRRLSGGPWVTCGESAFSPRLWSCWGDNIGGLVTGFNAPGSTQFLPFATPLLPSALSPPTDVFVGGAAACALVDFQDSHVTYCWGNALGGVRELLVVEPCALSKGGLGCTNRIEDASRVAFGAGFACANGPRTGASGSGSFGARSAGCWGTDTVRTVRMGPYELPPVLPHQTVPQWGLVSPQAVQLPAGTQLTSLAAAGSAACGLAGGRAFCWGVGFAGGNGASAFEEVLGGPFTALAGTGETGVAGFAGRFCGVRNGAASCWTAADHTPGPEPLLPEDVATLRVSATHICAITTPSGALYCWGANGNGQLGTGSKGGVVATPTRVLEPRGNS